MRRIVALGVCLGLLAPLLPSPALAGGARPLAPRPLNAVGANVTHGVERARGERPAAAGERRRGQEWRQESQAHPEGDDPSHHSRSTLKFTPRRRG